MKYTFAKVFIYICLFSFPFFNFFLAQIFFPDPSQKSNATCFRLLYFPISLQTCINKFDFHSVAHADSNSDNQRYRLMSESFPLMTQPG